MSSVDGVLWLSSGVKVEFCTSSEELVALSGFASTKANEERRRSMHTCNRFPRIPDFFVRTTTNAAVLLAAAAEELEL